MNANKALKIKLFLNNKAFTLIELLVTVLIISILAAISFSNYQKSVLKTKASEALLNLPPIAQAQNRFYLAVGRYSQAMEDLDIIPAKLKYFNEYIFHDEHVEVTSKYEGVDYWLTVFYNDLGTLYCGIVASEIEKRNPCAILSTDKQPRTDLYHGYLAYRI